MLTFCISAFVISMYISRIYFFEAGFTYVRFLYVESRLYMSGLAAKFYVYRIRDFYICMCLFRMTSTT